MMHPVNKWLFRVVILLVSLSALSYLKVYGASGYLNEKPVYLADLDSLTNNYLAQNQPAHDRMWNLHKILLSRLRKAGIDTILYYQSGCVGCEVLPDRNTVAYKKSCLCSEEEQQVYLFWQDHGKTLSKKLDCCQNQPVTLGKALVVNFYFQHQATFQAGDKFFQDFEAYNRSHPKAVRFLPPTSVHDDVTDIQFYLAKRTVQFSVRKADFTEAGVPKYLRYSWKRKQWEWTQLIKKSTLKI